MLGDARSECSHHSQTLPPDVLKELLTLRRTDLSTHFGMILYPKKQQKQKPRKLPSVIANIAVGVSVILKAA